MNSNPRSRQRLKTIFALTVLGSVAVEGTVLAQQYHQPAGRDAFLKYQVGSTDELIAAIRKDSALRARYARHFGIPEDRVIDFVKNSLIVYRLPKGRYVDNYGVTRSGHIYKTRSYLKAGTRVWATRSGLPVLKWACANPLTKNLPGTLLASRPKPTRVQVAKAPSGTAPSNALAPVAAPIPTASLTAPVLAAPTAGAGSSLTLPPALAGAGSTVIPPVVAATVPVSGGGGGTGILPFLPLAFLFPTGGGGSSTTPTPTEVVTVPTPTPTPGEVIPTPAPTPAEVTPSEVTPTPTPTPPGGGGEVVPTPTPTPPGGGGEIIPTPTPTPPGEVGPTTTPVVPTPTPPPGGEVTPPANAIPEPGTFALMAMAGLPVLGYAVRRRNGRTGK
jgi:hypothetical protein